MNLLPYILASIILFHTTFIYIDDGSGFGRIIQAVCTVLLFAYLFPKWKSFFRKKYLKLNAIVALISICVTITTYVKASYPYLGPEMSSSLLGYMTAVDLILLFWFVEYTNYKGYGLLLTKIFYYCLTAYLLVVDVDLILNRPTAELIEYDRTAFVANLIGGKFSVSYKHVFWMLLFYMLHAKAITKGGPVRLLLAGHFFVAIIAAYLVKCTTSIIGLLAVLMLFVAPKKLKELSYKPWVLLLSILVFDSFLLLFAHVLQSDFAINLLTNVLHKDSSLTGRMDIYSEFMTLLNSTPFWGFGTGNSYKMTDYLIGADNSQNGLIEMYMLYGIPILFTFPALVNAIIKHCPNLQRSFPILVYLYFFAVISSVEITLGLTFIYYASFMLISFTPRKKKRKPIITIE